MTYRIEHTHSRLDESGFVLVRSETARLKTLRLIGKCFIGLGLAGAAGVWFQLGLWKTRTEMLFPILLGLSLIVTCLGAYFTNLREFPWPTKIRFLPKQKTLIFSSESSYNDDLTIPYQMLLGIKLFRRKVRSTIASSRVQVDLYRVALIFENLSNLTLLTFPPIPKSRRVPKEYLETFHQIRTRSKLVDGHQSSWPGQESIPPARFFFDNSKKNREIFWHSIPSFQELWLLSIPFVVLVTITWVEIQSGLRRELYWSVALSSIIFGAYLGRRIARHSATRHRLRFTQNSLEIETTGFLGRKNLRIPINWIGDFRPYFPEIGGLPAIDIVERSASAHQRTEFNSLDENEHEFLEDLNIFALPFHFGRRRRIPTADLNLRELIFLADWLNTNRDSE
ncbi:MAG: hypothetical protein VYC39_19815 [Myxococcota bacterium]|nr:hypothetical protein [Myxococcota bacterium]